MKYGLVRRCRRPRSLALVALAALVVGAPRVFSQQPIAIEPEPDHLALFDLDGDGGIDMVGVDGPRLRWRLAGGEEQSALIPGESALWCVAVAGADRRAGLLALVDGESLQLLELGEAGPAWRLLHEGLGGRGLLPHGHRPAEIVRDVDGDGLLDLLVPLGDRVRLWFGDGAGFQPGPELSMSSALAYDVGGAQGRRQLLGRVSRTLKVPILSMRDLSGDGRPDLLVQDGKGIYQYVAGAEGLPLEPTAQVDLGVFEERLPAFKFDARNISSLARLGVWEQWSDLNLDGADDLLVLAGGNVLIYLGGEHGLDLRRPRDQLPVSGNVLYAFAVPIDGDETPDLVLLRIEDVSLARALTWWLFSFSVDLELLVYQGLGTGRFAKRPLPQSKTIELKVPSLRNLMESRDVADELRRTIARLADFDGDGRRTDLVVLDPDGRLRGWLDLVPDPTVLEQAGGRFLQDLLAQDRTLDVDAETLVGWILGRASLLVRMAGARSPSFEQQAPPDWLLPQALAVRDFDGDGRDEVLVLRRQKPGEDGVERRRLEGYLYDPAPPR